MDKTERRILNILKRRGGQRLSLQEIQRRFTTGRERKAVLKQLARLVSRGKVTKDADGKFSITSAKKRLVGRFEPTNERFGFVIPVSPETNDIYVPAQRWGGAIDGDIVEVAFTKRRGGRTTGQIVRIVKRTRHELAGKVLKRREGMFLVPLSAKVFHEVVVVNNEAGPVEDGLVVNAVIDKIDDRLNRINVSIVEVWGKPDDPEVLCRIVIARFNIPTVFSDEALDEARRVPRTITESDLRGRADLRSLVTFTIDGEQAKDFDDAVSIERRDGGFRLWVHIADVSHYVAEGSALDKDAYERANSVYFPGSVIPMLPFELSNEICSLKPNEDRLAMSVQMDLDKRGEVCASKMFKSVIRSNARLTYTEVGSLLEQHRKGKDVSEDTPGFAQYLYDMDDAAQLLTKARMSRGSLDFDLPDPVIILDLQGKPEDIVREERNPAHRLIEEFMIAANEAVASYLTVNGCKCAYRVHEPPDDESLIGLSQTLKSVGMKVSFAGGDLSNKFQQLIQRVRGKRIERLVSYLILRALKIAKYSPENIGHFGLASSCYAHFTSPIRRYPDLMVHRFLKQQLKGKSKGKVKMTNEALKEATHHCSVRERAAMGAERKIVKMRQAQFMADRVGERFTGIISGLTARGFFVELDQFFVEGFVPLVSLSDDRYSFSEEKQCITGEKTGRRFRMGDAVKVRVRSVQVPLGRIDFKLIDAST
ncbi:MAG: ribonuclease R [Candidatus Coatesbacteria bacterium]|nr:MAG: ribonuclease R [Candidatus Coatesbacteria bacterium]